MSQTAPSPATAQLLRVPRHRHPAGCLLCSSSPLWSREKEKGNLKFTYTSGTDDAPHREDDLQPHMVLEILEPEAVGAVQVSMAQAEQEGVGCSHSHPAPPPQG